MQKLISKAEFSRLAGVSRGAISKATKDGGLVEAMVNKFVNADHPAAIKYLKARGKLKEDPKEEQKAVVKTEKPMSIDKKMRVASQQLKIAEKTKLLIRRDIVDNMFEALINIWDEYLETESSIIALKICKKINNLEKLTMIESLLKNHNKSIIEKTCEEVKREIEKF